MKKYRVTFEIFMDGGRKENRSVVVEAGNKKLAALRGMIEINKDKAVAQLFKNLIGVREVA